MVMMTDPNPDDPFNAEAAAIFKRDYFEFYRQAKAHTERHASGSS